MVRKINSIFVTVGTTKFESLIKVIDSVEFQKMVFESFGCSEILVQIGQGLCVPRSHHSGVEVVSYRLKPDIKKDMQNADLIITHCGAGSVMEALNISGKTVVAVVNDALMDNHQLELANALVEKGPFLFSMAKPADLIRELPFLDFESLVNYKSPDLTSFVDTLGEYIR